ARQTRGSARWRRTPTRAAPDSSGGSPRAAPRAAESRHAARPRDRGRTPSPHNSQRKRPDIPGACPVIIFRCGLDPSRGGRATIFPHRSAVLLAFDALLHHGCLLLGGRRIVVGGLVPAPLALDRFDADRLEIRFVTLHLVGALALNPR